MRATNRKEQQEQFIQLRAQGKSYNEISAELGISKGSCSNWAKRYAAEIERAAQTQAKENLPSSTKKNIPEHKIDGNLVFNAEPDDTPENWVLNPEHFSDKLSQMSEEEKTAAYHSALSKTTDGLKVLGKSLNEFTARAMKNIGGAKGFSETILSLLESYKPIWDKLDEIVDETIEAIPPEERAQLNTELAKNAPSGQNSAENANIKAVLQEYVFSKAFAAILSSNVTTQLTTVNTIANKPDVDRVTGNATIKLGNGLELYIENYDRTGREWKTSTHKLLALATIFLAYENHYKEKNPEKISRSITFNIDDYLKLKGTPITKNTRKEARVAIKKDIDTLLNSTVKWKEKKKGKNDSSAGYMDTPIIGGSSGIDRGGTVTLSLSKEFAEYLVKGAYLAQYSIALFQTDERNPNIYPLGYKLLVHSSMDSNIIRGTANIISVKKALKNCPGIPTYEELKSKNDRHWDRKIKGTLEKALDSLQMIKWEYCKAKGEPLTDKELEIANYSFFIGLYIHFEVIDTPDQTERIKRKVERIEKAKKSKEKTALAKARAEGKRAAEIAAEKESKTAPKEL